ncbi:MAG TPA: hypothetical protein VGF24_25530 [Vicinamibacterales bacterium]
MSFWHGCNYPWSTDGQTVFYGMDFGANIWGSHLGVSTRRPQIERDFAQMAALGFTVARWFVFGDGRSGIAYDDRGLPTGPDAHLFTDLDAALAIAGQVGIRLNLVLLDHQWMFAGIPDVIADPSTGALLKTRLPQGRARVLRTRAGREALMSNVIEPLVARFGHRGTRADLAPHVFAFEFMNEPDFVVEEWERDLSPRVVRPLQFESLAELVSSLSALVHAHTTALTTMSCARLENLWAWDDPGLDLDCVQLHSYPDTRHPQRDRDVFGTRAASLDMTRPVILGEFPCDGPRQHPAHASPPPWTLDDYLEFALRDGYAGAWPWSFSGTDAYGPVPEAPLREFARRHPELVNPLALGNGGDGGTVSHGGTE